MDRLLELLTTRSFSRKRVRLASGRESDFFIDCKQTALTAEGHCEIGSAMLKALEGLETRPVAVAGVELGGCSLASSVALISHQRGDGIDAIYVRKQAKNHGSQRLLEGDGKLKTGSPVAVLEDVVTTGGSTLKAVEKLRARGLNVVAVVALVDRLEGGAEALRDAGLNFIALYTRLDFMGDAEAG